jgi:ATP/maltotriose-dependent transcriptional regulator MalT
MDGMPAVGRSWSRRYNSHMNFKEEIQKLLDQCKAYEVVLPPTNSEALAIIELFKSQFSTLIDQIKVDEEKSGDNPLSAREMQVLALIADGHPNKEIAFQLSISPKTVQFHIKSVFTKLEVSSRTEAVTVALKYGFLAI